MKDQHDTVHKELQQPRDCRTGLVASEKHVDTPADWHIAAVDKPTTAAASLIEPASSSDFVAQLSS